MSALETVKATLAHAAAAQSEMTAGIVATTPLLPKLNSNAAASASTSQPSTPLRAKNQQQIISLASAAGVAAGSVDKDRLETAGTAGKGKMQPKPPEEFWKDLQQFHDRRGTPMTHAPKISGQLVDLFKLYNEVTERGGFNKVNMRDEWDEVYSAMESLREKCVNGTAAIKHLYRRYLDKYERLNFFGEDPDKMEALEAAIENGDIGGGRSRSRYSQHGSLLSSIFGNNISALTAVPMSYNHRQHIVNMDRRRQFKLSMDLHKNTPLEKLLLSLLSPLPNEQDFAINVCTLMTNEAKSALKLTECAKIVDVLLAHMGVYADYTMRKLFQHVYTNIRRHSQYGFWRDLLQDKPQILDLYTDEQAWLDNGLVKRDKPKEDPIRAALLEDCHTLDFLNLRRGNGTHDYMGQRVLQIMQIFRSLSFFDENLSVLAKNRTFWRFIVMAGNIRWGNIHIQALETAGNVATEFELHDPTTDELSRNLMAMLCEGIDSMDRGVIINSLEILYKLCNKEGNDQHVYSCLNVDFYRRLSLLLTLNDVMMLIFTLEAIYAISSLGSRSCANFMQVRGFVDQLVSLITVEAQTYGPDGCILMRVVEIVPGNMLPMVAQNIANLQNAAVNKHQAAPLVMPQQPILAPPAPHEILQQQQTLLEQQPMPMLPQPSLPQVHLPPPQHVVATPAAAQSFTQDDEQYALAWLGATFERATSNESHIEQQELYRMYLGHCQKSGKHSVVNHVQFPRLVRLIFNSTVGPVVVRRIDGNELPGLHYVSIRLRAQPLPIQNKNAPTVSAISPKVESARKKKKMKQEAAQNTTVESTAEPVSNPTPPAINTTSVEPKTEAQLMITATATTTQATLQPEQKSVPAASADELTASSSNLQPQQTSTSSLIKSLLANKVNQRQQKQKELVAAPTVVATTSTSIGSQQQPAMPITTVAQLQQQQQQQTLPIKVTSTAISALVNNPLMHHTPVKVGQTTIKPLNPQMTLEKKTLISDSAPPPLAPLSGSNVVTKDASGRTVIIANQSLVDLPNTIIKRKMTIDDNMENIKRVALDNSTVSNTKEDTVVTPSKNAANLYAEMAASILEDEDLDDIPPLLATQQQQEIAQAPHQQQQQQQQQQLVKMQLPQNASVQRQIVFQTNAQGQPTGAPQLKLTAGNATQQIPTAMATIKTDQGLQTVPVILQPKSLDQGQSTQILQQVIQHAQQTGPQPVQQQTQYVLATNQQGQTYLVAQQQPPPPPPPTQTVLVTQTPQQQTTGTKTIIILQQQALPNQNASTQQQQIITTGPGLGGGQKMIMTTAQGQQVLVTQRPTTPQQQIIINPQTGAATHIQHGHGIPVSSGGGSNASTLMQRPQSSSATGQISPSLLSQLNQIPATIKLHQPQPPPVPQPPQQATISRIGGKTVQLVQTPTPVVPPPPPALQIPQLQQHQSIIQQHIISGPNEKRQMLLSGGRAIEIKETLITQTPPVQQSQLNSQTIITTQQAPAQQVSAVLQQQQHIRAVIEQQQHPSIIQQKITMPHVQQQQQQAQLMVTQQQQQQQFSTPGGQASTELPTLVQTTPQIVNKSHLKQTLVTTKKPLEPKAATVASIQSPAAATTTTTTADAAAKPTARIEEKPTTTIPATAAHITTTTTTPSTPATTTTQSTPAAVVPVAAPPAPPPTTTTVNAIPSDVNWLFICDWRNCPRRKFKSLGELQHHVCTVHCPDHLDTAAEIFCQWGTGPGFCDNVPRKRFSLMTHLIDRHLSLDSLRASVQRRIATGIYNVSPAQPAVTIVRNMENLQRGNTASPAPSSGSSSSSTNAAPGTAPAAATNLAGSSALQAIKRHTADFVNPKELMDENEGPVTKSIRLTAALILRNLVMYTTTAKRQLRYHEPHLANVALSNVESSSTLSQILYELNN